MCQRMKIPNLLKEARGKEGGTYSLSSRVVCLFGLMGAHAHFVRSITPACGKYRITYGRFIVNSKLVKHVAKPRQNETIFRYNF